MDPALAAALAQYLAANCSGSISLQCGPGGPAPTPRGSCPERYIDPAFRHDRGEYFADCAVTCPEPDYGDPDQPYFWDHTSMGN